ncbi:hypothetical protein HYT56_02025 [Candidatus Woesearchaeota archaeon]|nr:hypothetical protein [Candidatus Woesearchaeota archaeon]
MIRFNVTATSSIEDLALWNITVASDDDAGGAVGTNETSLTIFVDGLAPRILEINITDGNVTLFNGTGDGSSALFLNDTNIFTSESDFLVYATVEDLNVAGADDVMWLVYNETDFFTANNANMEREEEENFTSVPGGVGSNANVSEKALVLKGKVLNDWKRYVNNTKNYQTLSALVSWTIPGNLTVDANISEFMFLFNDSYDQGMSQGAGGSDAGAFKVTTNSSVFPTIVNINISDGTNHVVDAALHGGDVNSTYVQASNLTLDFDIDDGKGLLNITVFYNETGNFLQNSEDLISGAPFINGKVTSISNNFTQDDGNSKIANITIHDVNSATRERYQVSFQVDANNNTNTLTFVVVMNGTNLGGVDNPDNSEDQELEEGNYSIIGGPYYVAIDGNAPNVELSTPAQRGITTADSITYKCTGSDGESGVAKYIWYLKKPGSNEFTKIAEKSQSAAHEQSFSGTDIGAPGDYDVKCEVEDVVANKGSATTTSNNQFTVSISSVGAGGTGGGAGGAGAAVSFDVDFTAAPQATFKASQGRVKSFSFDGTTKHTITFNEVTANSVTLVIASDPITVLLNAGQSKSVDVNADGTDDMKVQLNSVDNGVADVTVTKLEEGAAKIKAEEEGARGVTETGEEREVTPVAGKSLAWLWWTLIVIVAIVAIGYYVNKRK